MLRQRFHVWRACGRAARQERRFRQSAPPAQGVFQVGWIGFIENRQPRSIKARLQICLSEVVWRMRFGRNGADPIESDNSAMYILSAGDDRFEIVFQIDHQDLAKRIQKLRLK